MSDPQQGNGAPQALTEEKVAQMVAQIVNQAFSARSKTLKKELSDDMGKNFEGLQKRLDEMSLTKADSRRRKPGEEGDEPDKSTPEFRGMQRQLQDMKSSLEERDRKLAEANQRQRTTELRQRVSEELGRNGVTDPRSVKGAMAILVSDEQRIRYDDDGSLVFVENQDSVLDLSTGIKAWMKSDDAKLYLPPSGAMGSGGRPVARQVAPANAQPSDADDSMNIGLALVQQFGGTGVPMT